jgi:hypothetical protein
MEKGLKVIWSADVIERAGRRSGADFLWGQSEAQTGLTHLNSVKYLKRLFRGLNKHLRGSALGPLSGAAKYPAGARPSKCIIIRDIDSGRPFKTAVYRQVVKKLNFFAESQSKSPF